MKDAVIAYSMLDISAMHNQLPELDTPLRRELRKDSALWKKSMMRATLFLRDNLHQANPLVAEMIKIWHRHFEYVDLDQEYIYEQLKLSKSIIIN